MKQVSKISNNIYFNSYLLNGRKWPQTRWANVIVLISDIGKLNAKFTIDNDTLKTFFKYKLSPNELIMLRQIMNNDHANAGINLNFIDDEKLECDFIKTQIGVKQVVKAFLDNKPLEYFKEKDLSNIKNEYDKLQYFNQVITSVQGDKLYDIANICQLEINNHKGLAKLFRATYYNHHNMELFKTPEYLFLIKFYNINLDSEKDILPKMREQITITMFDYMKIAVTKQYPNIQPFFIYSKQLH